MLSIKNIKKVYKSDVLTTVALDDVSINFRKAEFVAILGPSGSGKTTLLNVLGGLDRYDKGDLIINGKSTKDFKNKDWDSYRNNHVGFIFQSYNLINHISVLDNVCMGMTLSGVKSSLRKKKAMDALRMVGLEEHARKKPNQLSGGQMQRVAIARAIVNNPDIILADEPTGALDSKTSEIVMDLIKKISLKKLVIMVTHNEELAKCYADRIITFSDGHILSDSRVYNPISNNNKYSMKKTAMSFLTALKLSFNNIRTKKGRTILTAFASSIGIIGIAIILSLSNGFDKQIKKFEEDTLSSLPIIISKEMMIDYDMIGQMKDHENIKEEYTDKEIIYSNKEINSGHINNITKDYISYVEKIDNNLISGISYNKLPRLNVVYKNVDKYKMVQLSSYELVNIPRLVGVSLDNKDIFKNYDLLKGSLPKTDKDLLLVVDSRNGISAKTLELLGFNRDSISFDDIINKEYKLILNDDYYLEKDNYFTINSNIDELYNNSSISLRITGIIRGNIEKEALLSSSSGIYISDELINYLVDKNSNSKIVKAQRDSSFNVLTKEVFNDLESRNNMLSLLGDDVGFNSISIYPKDFASKEDILKYLDKYNEGISDEGKILYTDMGHTIVSLSSNIMDAITIVLVAFSSISLVVSSIMIGIITYISVLERTKEIGILRSLGARRKDIKRVFNAEVFIIGFISGVIGIVIARLLIIPINIILESLTNLSSVAKMNPVHIVVLVLVSIVLTLIGGAIPAGVASKKDPVVSLRVE